MFRWWFSVDRIIASLQKHVDELRDAAAFHGNEVVALSNEIEDLTKQQAEHENEKARANRIADKLSKFLE